jgi:uncharacterized protein (DUF4415 family)
MTKLVRRAAGTPLSEDELHQLKALAKMPDDQIDFSDIPERPYTPPNQNLPLEEHTVTLHVDAEVAGWLETAGKETPEEVNQALRRAVRRFGQPSPRTNQPLHKAS